MNKSSAFLVTIYVANPKNRFSRAYCSAIDSDFQDIRDCDTFSVMKFFQLVLRYLPFPLEPLFDLYIAFNNHSNSHNTAVISQVVSIVKKDTTMVKHKIYSSDSDTSKLSNPMQSSFPMQPRLCT